MARKLDIVKDIDGNRETLKLSIRIIDLWVVGNKDSFGSKGHMEIILMDQKVTYLVKVFFFIPRHSMIMIFMCFYVQGDVIPTMTKKKDIEI